MQFSGKRRNFVHHPQEMRLFSKVPFVTFEPANLEAVRDNHMVTSVKIPVLALE